MFYICENTPSGRFYLSNVNENSVWSPDKSEAIRFLIFDLANEKLSNLKRVKKAAKKAYVISDIDIAILNKIEEYWI